MGKQGPCCHCGISTTPLWRNGPPEKPVLCNACGSRWRTKGTLVNYMPMHSGGCGVGDSSDYRWARGKKGPQKFKEQRSHKRKEPCDVRRDIEFGATKSNLQYARGLEEDASTRSSSVSGISYSEGCMQHSGLIEKDNTVAVHTSVWDSPVPSKKRTCVFRQRPSSVEKLTKGMQYILQEQDSSYLSSSSEEDLLYGYKPPLVAVEIGLGSVFIRQPHSAIKEEESEASSLLIENKGYNTFDVLTQAYSGAVVPSVRLQDGDKAVTERWHENVELLQEHSAKNFIPNKALLESFLQSCHSPLIFMDLKDIVNFDTFMEFLKDDEQMQLLKYVSSVDDSAVPESLKCMFTSSQFKGALSNFQQLLSEGMFDIYGSGLSPQVQQLFQQLLIVTDLTKSKWMDRYSLLQHRIKNRGPVDSSKCPENKDSTKSKGPNLLRSCPKFGVYTALKNSSGRPPGHIFAGTEKDIKSPVRLQKSSPATMHPFTPGWKNASMEGTYHESIDAGSTSKEAVGFEVGPKSGPCCSPNSLFASPPQRCSSVVLDSTGALADEGSDSVLLFDVPSNLSFPQAELLHAPVLKCKSPKDIADASNLENPSSGGPTVNNTWDSEDSLEWGGLFWDPSYAGSSQTLPNGTVLNPGKLLN